MQPGKVNENMQPTQFLFCCDIITSGIWKCLQYFQLNFSKLNQVDQRLFCSTVADSRGVFRNLPNIYDEVFYKNS